MFEQARDYPTAVTQNGGADPKGSQAVAIAWVQEQQRLVGGTVLLIVPKKTDLDPATQQVARFAQQGGVVVGTWRGPITGWGGGPVLAAWPHADKLAQIADDRRTRALCVIPWIASETAAWERAASAERLGGTDEPLAPLDLDPVVVVGLRYLTSKVNHANQLVGAYDHRDAVAVLRVLHRGGYRLPAADVYAWALAHGWPGRGAGRLREMAAKIDAGRTIQMRGTDPLRPDILDLWRAKAVAARD